MINPNSLHRSLVTLDVFVDRALRLRPKSPELSGFHYNRDLLKAAMADTYLETVGTRADTIHAAIKGVHISSVYTEYLETVHVLSMRAGFQSHDAVLAFELRPIRSVHLWCGDSEGLYRGVAGASELSERAFELGLMQRIKHTEGNDRAVAA